MSDKPRVAVRNAGAFLTPDLGGGVGLIPVPMNALSVGPGKPGPEDEWKMPADPADGPAVQEAPVAKPAHEGMPNPVTRRG
jgi:hypothetical protein